MLSVAEHNSTMFLDLMEQDNEEQGKKDLIMRHLYPERYISTKVYKDDDAISLVAPSEASFLDIDNDMEPERYMLNRTYWGNYVY